MQVVQKKYRNITEIIYKSPSKRSIHRMRCIKIKTILGPKRCGVSE